MKKLALITGATAGIGEACAEEFARRGYDLILTGRRQDRLKMVCEKLAARYGVEALPVCFDISSRSETEKALKSVDTKLERLDVLINNAGLAQGTDLAPQASIDDWEMMIDTNVKGLMIVTRICLPYLQKRRGHIVNLGSVAGRWVYPGGAVYCATKFAVRAFTEGLRLDLMGSGVRVTNIQPGMVETEFSLVRLKDEAKAKAVYKGMDPLTAGDIAETVAWCVDRPQHVNIQELVIYPTDQGGVGPAYTHRKGE